MKFVMKIMKPIEMYLVKENKQWTFLKHETKRYFVFLVDTEWLTQDVTSDRKGNEMSIGCL